MLDSEPASPSVIWRMLAKHMNENWRAEASEPHQGASL